MSAAATAKFKRHAEATARKERAIQRTIDRKDKSKTAKKAKPMQAGAREYPVPPFPKQHLKKPGREADLELAPMYDAPYYKGSEKLHGKVALITGGDSGIGRAVAVLFAREGADVAIAYLNEHEDAEETQPRGRGGRPPLHPDRRRRADRILQARRRAHGDASSASSTFWSTTPRSRSMSSDFEDLTEEHFDRTMKTNLYGYFHMAKAAVPHMKAGSAIVITGSVTGLLGNKDLLDYSMTKGGIHAFTRSLATHLVDQRHPRQRRCAGAGLDAAQSGRQGRRRWSRSSVATRR